MKKVLIIAFCILNFFTACVKKDEGIETLGVFNEQVTGFEGTVKYLNGKTVNNYPLRLIGGDYGASISVSQTGNISVNTSPDAVGIYAESDDKGKFKVTVKNKDFPLWNGFLAGEGFFVNSVFEEYFPLITEVEKPFKTTNANCVYGKVKKVDVVLYETAKLILKSTDIQVPYDKIEIRGVVKNVFSSEKFDIFIEQSILEPGSLFGKEYYIKPNEPIELTVNIFKDNRLSETRKMIMPMNKFRNYILIN
jgi:hypothetical protein